MYLLSSRENGPTAIDEKADARDEVVIDQCQHGAGDMFGRTFAFNQRGLDGFAALLLREIRRKQDRPRLDAVDAHARIARA